MREWLLEARKQLITEEDFLHVHKTLGVLCLLSFAIRLFVAVQYGAKSDMGFATHPHYTVPTVVLHFLLNASSFEFTIPVQRIKSGYRIWPEYRLHSLVFAGRSLAFITMFWFDQHFRPQNQAPIYSMNLIIILLSMASADLASLSLAASHRSGFARNLQVPVWVKYFFSMMQLRATTFCLMDGLRRCSTHFLFLFIIQGNAFLMTIRRKNLASHGLLVFMYGALLAVVALIGKQEIEQYSLNTERAMALVANLAALLRLGPRIPGLRYLLQDNKYTMWILLASLDRIWRRPPSSMTTPEDQVLNVHLPYWMSEKQLQVATIISSVALFALGLYKVREEWRQQDENGAQ